MKLDGRGDPQAEVTALADGASLPRRNLLHVRREGREDFFVRHFPALPLTAPAGGVPYSSTSFAAATTIRTVGIVVIIGRDRATPSHTHSGVLGAVRRAPASSSGQFGSAPKRGSS